MLAVLVDGPFGRDEDADGRVMLVDRNPVLFRHVLEYLRYNTVPPEVPRELHHEFDFFGLDWRPEFDPWY